jgi:hypothetical protein
MWPDGELVTPDKLAAWFNEDIPPPPYEFQRPGVNDDDSYNIPGLIKVMMWHYARLKTLQMI